jgi:hypothetical protein
LFARLREGLRWTLNSSRSTCIPLAGDGGGGAATPVETLPENPTLNSVADSGLTPEELAASPSDADLGIEPAATLAVASTTPADPNLAGAAT